MTAWVFALWLVVPLPAVPGARTFAADGHLGPYPTREACQAARAAIHALDPSTEHYFLESCTPGLPAPTQSSVDHGPGAASVALEPSRSERRENSTPVALLVLVKPA